MDYLDFSLDADGSISGPASDGSPRAVDAGVPAQTGTSLGQPSTSNRITVSLSTAFHPGARLDERPWDIVLSSSDKVLFNVHRHRILGVSVNGFASLILPPEPTDQGEHPSLVMVSEHSAVLNIALHVVYDLPVVHYEPPFDALSQALEALVKYGVQPAFHAAPGTPLFNVLRAYAPTRPIETYALAAQYNLEGAAVAISAHLLSFSLPSLSDKLAAQIGPIYLKRLFFLHHERIEALKRMLLQQPDLHTPSNTCGSARQKNLTRAWALASANLLWEVRPDLSTASIQAALRPLENDLSCYLCKQSLRARISQLVSEWSAIKRTI